MNKKDNNDLKNFHFDNVYFENPQTYDDIVLYQIGDLSCTAGYEIGEHVQACYEISYIVSGKGRFFTDDQWYTVEKGDIFINSPGQCHNGIADGARPFRYYYLGFIFCEQKEDNSPMASIRKIFDKAANPVSRDAFSIHEPFVNIFNEMLNLNQYSELMIKTLLHQIVILAFRNYHNEFMNKYSQSADTDSSKKLAYEIINYIDSHLDDIQELSKIADRMGYCYAYVSRVFSAEIGSSIQEYYQHKRFEKAVKLLRSGEYSISEIAEEMQYMSIHSFSKAFRKKFGISPSAYQQLYNKSKMEQELIKGR